MSQPPPESLSYQTYATARPSNGLGVAGFIISIVGLFSCGILAPVGLALSAFGMRRQPRQLAIAGLIISIIGLMELLGIVVCVAGTVHGVRTVMRSVQVMTATELAVDTASHRVVDYRSVHSALPEDADGVPLIASNPDGWGHPLRYHKVDEAHFELRSAGEDGAFDTPDDMATQFDDTGAEIPATMPFRPRLR